MKLNCWQLALVLLSVLVLTLAQLAISLPVPTDDRLLGTPSAIPKQQLSSNEDGRACITGVCGDKGKFCEIICKNNPSEGGKMCK